MKRVSLIFLWLAVFSAVLVGACSGDDDDAATPTVSVAQTATTTGVPEASATAARSETPTRSPATPTTATATSTTAPTATPEPAASTDSLSMVYIDTRRGQGGDIYVADADGSNPHFVLNEPSYSRPLDVAGGSLAAAGKGGVVLVDLATGKPVYVNEDTDIFSGRFFDEQTFFYSTRGSCIEGGATLKRVEMPALKVTPLVMSRENLTIIDGDLATNTLAVVPRGCDVGVANVNVYDALTGQLRNQLDAMGCGWALAALDQAKVVVSWQSCTRPAGRENVEATVYDFGIVGPTGHDLTAPDEGSNADAWLRRPGHAEAALGTTKSEGSGPGSERGAGSTSLTWLIASSGSWCRARAPSNILSRGHRTDVISCTPSWRRRASVTSITWTPKRRAQSPWRSTPTSRSAASTATSSVGPRCRKIRAIGGPMAYDEGVADRVREAVAKHGGLSERKMFGGLCLMVNGNMFAGIIGEELMLRVGPERFEELLSEPAARPMDFTGRPMKGYLYIAPDGFAADGALSTWLEAALAFVESLPAKQPGAKKKMKR